MKGEQCLCTTLKMTLYSKMKLVCFDTFSTHSLKLDTTGYTKRRKPKSPVM